MNVTYCKQKVNMVCVCVCMCVYVYMCGVCVCVFGLGPSETFDVWGLMLRLRAGFTVCIFVCMYVRMYMRNDM